MTIPISFDRTDGQMLLSSNQKMTEAEFAAWLTDDVRAEWVNGEVVLMAPAALRHVRLTSWLNQVLGLYIQSKKLGELLGPEFTVRLQHTGTSRRVPDLLFVSHANSIKLRTHYLDGAPDLAIEIVSPESSDRDWHDKFNEYEASGVLEYWIIDPSSESAKAFVRNHVGRFEPVELDEQGILHCRTVPGYWLKPDWLWKEELPDPIQCLRDLGVL